MEQKSAVRNGEGFRMRRIPWNHPDAPLYQIVYFSGVANRYQHARSCVQKIQGDSASGESTAGDHYIHLFHNRIEHRITSPMKTQTQADVTRLLVNWTNGDKKALEALMPLVYGELHRLAKRYLRRERSDHTLQSTALVHEAYLRMVDQKGVQWQNRAHFFAVAAQMIRRILVDHARTHKAEKRGGGVPRLALDEAIGVPQRRDLNLVALDDAINGLAEMDPQQGRIVELRFFGGLSIEETAEVLGISPATVKRDWAVAKAWLYRDLSGRESVGGET